MNKINYSQCQFLFFKTTFLISFWSLFVVQNINGQILTLFADTIAANKGDTVSIDIKARDFDALASFKFAVQWDETVLEFINLEQFAPLPFYNENFFFIPSTDINYLLTAWFDPTAVGQNLMDGTPLFSIVFKVIGEIGSRSPIEIGDRLSYDTEAATKDKVIDVVLENGLVKITNPITTADDLIPTIPTVSQWGLLILGLLTLNIGLIFIWSYSNYWRI